MLTNLNQGLSQEPHPFPLPSHAHLMCHQGDARVVQVEPGWDLPVGDDEDVPDPGDKLLQGTQRVPQLLVILKTTGRHYVWSLQLLLTLTTKNS